jgi:hypothetical protein
VTSAGGRDEGMSRARRPSQRPARSPELTRRSSTRRGGPLRRTPHLWLVTSPLGVNPPSVLLTRAFGPSPRDRGPLPRSRVRRPQTSTTRAWISLVASAARRIERRRLRGAIDRMSRGDRAFPARRQGSYPRRRGALALRACLSVPPQGVEDAGAYEEKSCERRQTREPVDAARAHALVSPPPCGADVTLTALEHCSSAASNVRELSERG